MHYITAKQAAEAWGMDLSQIGKLARSGRIPGARQIGGRWVIPKDAAKPADGRTKAAKASSTAPSFRFPSYCNLSPEAYNPPLSAEELQLRQVELHLNACRLKEAAEALGTLPTTAENRYVRIAALYFSCLLSAIFADKTKGYDALKRFNLEFAESFPYKEEMLLLLYQLDAVLGGRILLSNDIKLQDHYSYHPSTTPFLLAVCIRSACAACFGNTKPDLSVYELNCDILERTDFLMEAQVIHLCLAFLWFMQEKDEKAKEHIRRVLVLARDHELYWVPAMFYLLCADTYEELFPEFDAEFTRHLTNLGKDLYQRFVLFFHIENLDVTLSELLIKDMRLIFSAMKDYPNKKIAALINRSETTVSNKYSEIYARLGVRNKKELKAYFLESLDPEKLKRRS